MIDIEKLEVLARAATPGPWLHSGRYIGTMSHMSYIGEVRDESGNWSDSAKSRNDSAFIAAAHPTAILELCALVHKQAAELAEARKLPAAGDEQADAWMAVVAALDKGMPGWLNGPLSGLYSAVKAIQALCASCSPVSDLAIVVAANEHLTATDYIWTADVDQLCAFARAIIPGGALLSAAPVAEAPSSPTIKQLVAQLADDEEKWTVREQHAFAEFLNPRFPNESSQGIISLGSAWKHGQSYAASQSVAVVANATLVEALREITDDIEERFDMDSPSTNPGIKSCVANARAALAAQPSAPAVAAQDDEPVAWMRKRDITELTDCTPETGGWTPLYAAPATPAPAVQGSERDAPLSLSMQQLDTLRFAAEMLEGNDCEDTAGDVRDIIRSASTPATGEVGK